MAECEIHQNHNHKHEKGCGHTAVEHDGHIDYVHDGHLHHSHDGHYDEHKFAVNEQNPDSCNPIDSCGSHKHGPNCGHEAVPHGDHIDYIVDGRLHHPHGDHCDDHGAIKVIKE